MGSPPTLEFQAIKDTKITITVFHIAAIVGWLITTVAFLVPIALTLRDGVALAESNAAALDSVQVEQEHLEEHHQDEVQVFSAIQTQMVVISCYHAHRAQQLRGEPLPQECR